jgi:predicted  nucleic acid-binding Zn-ribbon protein
MLQNDQANSSTNLSIPLVECLRELHRLDQQLISLQNKMEHPDKNNLHQELNRLKVREKEKRQQLDENRINKNQTEIQLEQCRQRLLKKRENQRGATNLDRLQKINADISYQESIEKTLELKMSQLQKECDSLFLSITSLQNEQNVFINELNPNTAEKQVQGQNIQVEIKELEKQKLHFLGQLPSRYLSFYQKIGPMRNGYAIAKVFKNSCDGCFMTFPPQFMIELNRSKTIEQCPSCKRLLLP